MSNVEGALAPVRKFTYPFPSPQDAADARIYFEALSRAEDGFFPIGANGQWHGGIHFGRETGTTLDQGRGVRCIADGEVVAYRIDDDYPVVEYATRAPAAYSTGFVLVRHRLQLPPVPQPDGERLEQASGDTAQKSEEPSLTLYSLYMHLRNWQAYATDTRIERPAFWSGSAEYVVGDKARDREETLAPGTTGLRVRDEGHRPIALLPRGTRLTLGAPVEGRRGFHEITGIVSGDTVPAGCHTGRAYLPELDRLSTPGALGSVVVLQKPVAIKAGELVGHPGQYQRYGDMNPLGASHRERPLVQVDVFTGEDLESFIRQGRARDAQLDAKQKNLLHIQPGARLVQEAAPDLELAADEAAACVGHEAGQRWTKGVRGAVRTVERSALTGFTPATRAYANGHLFLAAVRPEDGSELTLDQYNALSATDKSRYSQRKVLVPQGDDIWLDGRTANAAHLVHGPARAWSNFPLTLANASGAAVTHSRVLQASSADNVVAEADGTRWFHTTAGGASGLLEGWVREKNHPHVQLCSPWAWPGFVLMDTGSLQPRNLYARTITRNRQALPEEQGELESLAQTAEQSPLFDALCEAVDVDGNKNLSPLELRSALRTPWLAQALSRLVIRHHSEWAGPMDRWDAIDGLIPQAQKRDWEQEKGRIEALQFWDEIRHASGLLVTPQAHHLHAIGLIETFSRTCPDGCRIKYFELQTASGPFRVSKESFKYILEAENYEKYPYIPGGKTASGITIGYGYDLGHQTTVDVRRDLSGIYAQEDIEKFTKVLGKKGDDAQTALANVSTIAISEDDAMTLAVRMKRRYADKVVSIYPEAIELHPHSQGALLSLVINRGNSLLGERRTEMREIRDDLNNGTPEKIPSRLRSMKRLWKGQNLGGLLKRRENEAKLFEKGMKCNCWE